MPHATEPRHARTVKPRDLGSSRQPVEQIDPATDRLLMLIPVASSDRFAILDKSDFERIVREGASPHFQMGNKGSVVALTRAGPVKSVARLIARPENQGRVYCGVKGSDKFDLRTENIRVRRVRNDPRTVIGRPRKDRSRDIHGEANP